MMTRAMAMTRQPITMARIAWVTVNAPIKPAPIENVPMETHPPMKLAA